MPAKKKTMPAQKQRRQPGLEKEMKPLPSAQAHSYQACGKLQNRVAIVTGGDSGIGRAISVMFAKEGADVAVMYLNEHEDAGETARLVEQAGRRCLLIPGDITDSRFCNQSVDKAVKEFGRLDILVNNAAEQHPQEKLEDITDQQLQRTFATNIFGQFYMARRAIKYMKKGAAIINTTSVTAYRGQPQLLDYSSTKGAIVAFTRSLALALASRGIRVNAVAPGPIWTPLIPSTFPETKVETFGSGQPLGRPGQPDEVATCFVFLASEDSSYITGQVLHPNGGEIING